MERRLIILILITNLILVSTSLSFAQNTESKITILISNDDGYNAPGIKALAEALSQIAKVVVAAPSKQQSGTGHGITYREPIFVRSIHNGYNIPWYAITATPATCVRLGIESLMKEKPDLVISGINEGENLGLVTFCSGTVGAAREAAILGFPAIAVSIEGNNNEDYKATALFVKNLVNQLIDNKLLHSRFLLNVNAPAGIAKTMKGAKVTKLSLNPERDMYHLQKDLYFAKIYKANEFKPILDNDLETDVNAFSKGYITITPLSINQTDAPFKSLFDKLMIIH